jgi:hypothetical protein
MQLFTRRGSVVDTYVLCGLNPEGADDTARAWFERLAEPRYEVGSYGPSAGMKPHERSAGGPAPRASSARSGHCSCAFGIVHFPLVIGVFGR